MLSKSEILDHVWTYDFDGDPNIVETYISYLRKKIDRVDPPLIHTIRGVGYSLRLPRDRESAMAQPEARGRDVGVAAGAGSSWACCCCSWRGSITTDVVTSSSLRSFLIGRLDEQIDASQTQAYTYISQVYMRDLKAGDRTPVTHPGEVARRAEHEAPR